MLLRNNIILLENSIMHRSFKFFESLSKISTEQLPSYISPKVNKFYQVYSHIADLEKNYLNEFSSFTLRERYAVKNGANQSNNDLGFSSLWKNSIEEKISDNSILTGLKLDLENSDLESLNLTFNITETEIYSALRKGDIVILHSYLNSVDMNITKNQLLKCVIKDISSDSIKVSLRNKLISKRILDESMLWAIESDQIDSVERYIFSSLFNFVNSPVNLRNLIFGNMKPEFDNSYCCEIEGLNDNQKKIVQDAVNAKNYYLIQGPPGTGKTNLILKNIINELFTRTSENLLIAAYTNRAVDEIAGAISNISPAIPFIRIGSKEASGDYEHHLPQIIDKYGINEGYKRLKNTRVIISTISSLHTNAELFEIKKFDTLIVDEASQILETYLIGLVTRVKKFILIGDDKQLPPLTVQNPASLICDNQLLNSIGILNYSDSLFSRLSKICLNNNWNESLGSLIFQARMHSDIQMFPSINFYNDELRIIYENQNQNIEDFDLESDDIFEKMLAAGRMIFIDCPAEKGKINKVESDICNKLINIIQSKYKLNNELIGVISPFRVQCFEIYKRLDEYQKMFINVDTVERYQGSQRDFIIMSCAAGNYNLLERIKSEDYTGQVDRKLNVAITRAKSHFIMLGNSNILSGSKHYRQLIEFIKSKNSYYIINY
jgi:DNA replication ATP-dependent helicase Dna2